MIKYIVEKYDFRPRVKEVSCESVITDLFTFRSHNTGKWLKDFEYSKDAPYVCYDIYSIDTDASKVIILFPCDEFKDENIIYIKPRFYYEKISDGTKNRHGKSSIMEDEKCILTSFETEDAKNIMFTVINW